jgi:hypothetical protein
VENANNLVKQVMMSLSRKRRMQGIDTKWTKILGQVMSMCSSHSGIREYSTSSYQAVFSQPYHPELWCTVAVLRECKTIGQCLNLSLDDRLAKYVREYNIVDDISDLGGAFFLVSDMNDTDKNGDDDGDEEEGFGVSDDAFPEDALPNNDTDIGGECPSLLGMNLSVGSADTSCQPCEIEFRSSPTQELHESSVPVEGSTSLPVWGFATKYQYSFCGGRRDMSNNT